MGSPLSPVIADIVMQDLEKRVLETFNFDIPFYFRYVDDLVMAEIVLIFPFFSVINLWFVIFNINFDL